MRMPHEVTVFDYSNPIFAPGTRLPNDITEAWLDANATVWGNASMRCLVNEDGATDVSDQFSTFRAGASAGTFRFYRVVPNRIYYSLTTTDAIYRTVLASLIEQRTETRNRFPRWGIERGERTNSILGRNPTFFLLEPLTTELGIIPKFNNPSDPLNPFRRTVEGLDRDIAGYNPGNGRGLTIETITNPYPLVQMKLELLYVRF